MIRFREVSKSFGNIRAVDRVSFEIPPSRVSVVTGADGAGKSTLFKMALGLLRQDSGQIFLRGEDIGRRYSRVTSICGYMPERFSLYPDLSVEENLDFFADIHGVPLQRREQLKNRLLEKTGMSRFKKRRAGALSGGMKQKLALSAILLSAPELIILDEPTTGVDPLSRIEFFNIIAELRAEGKTVILSTPYLDEAERGDYIIFLKEGRIIRADSMDNLKKDFPAKLYRILPRGNIFDALEGAKGDESLRDNLYIRGKYIKYLRAADRPPAHTLPIPHTAVEEEVPRLEDMYLYYERQGGGNGGKAKNG